MQIAVLLMLSTGFMEGEIGYEEQMFRRSGNIFPDCGFRHRNLHALQAYSDSGRVDQKTDAYKTEAIAACNRRTIVPAIF
ncbi:MAG: hypothetical protein ACLVJO_04410 [[Clostridium] scindens]